MKIEIVHATEHMPDHYRSYYDGYRAVRLIDEAGQLAGEIVWRLASGKTVEITEMGIFHPAKRGQGLGSQLLNAALDDMRRFFREHNMPFRKVFLFAEQRNTLAANFYCKHGFRLTATIPNFYVDDAALLFCLDL